MLKTLLRTKSAWIEIFLVFGLSFFASSADAYNSFAFPNWNYIITLGAGQIRSTDTGNTAYFPASQPGARFYSYTPKQTLQRALLIDGFIGIQGMILPNWFLQLGLDYAQPGTSFKAEGYVSQGIAGGATQTSTYKYSVLGRQLLFEGKFLATIGDVLHPYLLAGLGGSFNKAYNYRTNVNTPFTRVYLNRTQTSFSYTVGAGIDLDVTNRMRIGIGYRFADLGAFKLGQASVNHANVSGTLSQSHLYTNALLGQVTVVL